MEVANPKATLSPYPKSLLRGSRQLFLKHDPHLMGWKVGDHIGTPACKIMDPYAFVSDEVALPEG